MCKFKFRFISKFFEDGFEVFFFHLTSANILKCKIW